MTTTSDRLARLLAETGPWTVAYVDGHGDRPRPAEEGERRTVRDRLREADAPDEDVDAVDRALRTEEGVESPSTHYLLVRGGTVELDERFTGPRLGPEVLRHGPAPAILPLLRHRASDVPYLLVETGREGGQLRMLRAQRAGAGRETEIEGREHHHLQKVREGGWSHRRIQAHAEETWKHNQSEIADAVDRAVRDHRPQFVVIAGDLRARQLLIEQLAPAAREAVVEVEVHTRADGADDQAVEDAVGEAVENRLREDIAEVTDLAAADDGALEARVREALQEARGAAIVLDARLLDSDATVDALDASPWVAAGEADALGAARIDRVPLAEGLARAALLTDARVLVREEEPLADDEQRPDRPAEDPIALLRWSHE